MTSPPCGRLPDVPLDWARVVGALAGRQILVVGDVMLDEYLAGDARRICPEAPVPIVETKARWAAPGGAANAAANAFALGGRVALGGATGADGHAASLSKAVRAAGVDPSGLVTDPSRPTTVKLRVLARSQQVIRIDTECTDPLPPDPADLLATWAERASTQADAVLLSDYGKGVISAPLCRRVIEAARRGSRPVVVDPKGADPSRYRGATILKPNLGELADLTGRPVATMAGLRVAATELMAAAGGATILVTRGADGMVLFRPGAEVLALPAAPAGRAFEVTGAGDTVAAALALGLAAGLPVDVAARVANSAAGVAIGKVGTAVVTPAELLAALAAGVPEFGRFAVDETQ